MSKKKSIVFGANGYIGRHLVKQLENEGHEVLPLGVEDASIDKCDGYQACDITNADAVNALNFEVDYIFVFAGLTGTAAGFDHARAYLEVNELGLLNVLNKRRAQGSARIVFPSTRLVYKGQKDIFLVENAEKEAKTIYAQNKLACEGYLEMYSNFYDVDYTTFRICVPYGNIFDSKFSYGTIGFFLNKATSGNDITLYGEGEPKRTFTHVLDITNSITKSLLEEKSKNAVLNIGSDDNLSLLEVAKMIGEKYKVGVSFVPWPDAAKRLESGDTIFGNEKIKSLTAYRNQYRIADWINTL